MVHMACFPNYLFAVSFIGCTSDSALPNCCCRRYADRRPRSIAPSHFITKIEFVCR